MHARCGPVGSSYAPLQSPIPLLMQVSNPLERDLVNVSEFVLSSLFFLFFFIFLFFFSHEHNSKTRRLFLLGPHKSPSEVYLSTAAWCVHGTAHFLSINLFLLFVFFSQEKPPPLMTVMSKFINFILVFFIYLLKTHTKLHIWILWHGWSLQADFLCSRYSYKAATLWMCCRASIFVCPSVSLILTRRKKGTQWCSPFFFFRARSYFCQSLWWFEGEQIWCVMLQYDLAERERKRDRVHLSFEPFQLSSPICLPVLML